MLLNPSVRLAYPLIGSAASGAGVISTLDAPARRPVTAVCWARRLKDAVTRRARVAQYLSTAPGACHPYGPMSRDDGVRGHLLVPQRQNRIDPARAMRGNQACGGRDDRQ